MKKLVALMLSIVPAVSMSIPAFALAVPNADEFNVDSHYTRVTSISEDCGVCVLDNSPTNFTELEFQDFENGDSSFTFRKNGVIIETCYVDRSESLITSTLNETGEVSNYAVPDTYDISLYSSPVYTYLGSIQYQFSNTSYVAQTGTALVWNAVTTNYSSTYNLNGKYQTIAGVASLIAGLFSFPSAIASQVAQYVLWALGISTGAASLIIPDFYVSAIEETSFWRAANSDTPSAYTYDEGSKYTITAQGYEGTVITESSYHEPLSFRAHNGALATDIFAMVWPGYIFHQVLNWIEV